MFAALHISGQPGGSQNFDYSILPFQEIRFRNLALCTFWQSVYQVLQYLKGRKSHGNLFLNVQDQAFVTDLFSVNFVIFRPIDLLGWQ